MSVIAGLTNDYADYVTTYEEYQVSICFCYIQGDTLFLDSSDMFLFLSNTGMQFSINFLF